MASQQGDGYFLYDFHPLTGAETPGPGNLVRQAGCAYALGRAADQAVGQKRREDLAASARRTIDTLLSRFIIRSGTSFIAELPEAGTPVYGKLGSIALALSATQSASLANLYQAERRRLVSAILHMQRAGGSFRCRTDSLTVADDGRSQNYFPGEALMALSVELRESCSRAQNAMAVAFPWYRARFRAQPTTAFVPWQLDAWRRYAEWAMGVEVIPNPAACADFIFEMADWLLQFQIGAAENPRLIGGYKNGSRAPGVSTATYTESMIRAFSMARLLADTSRANRYRMSALAGLEFMFRLQLMPGSRYVSRDPVRIAGGMPANLNDLTIRCDYDQHSLTCYLAAIETSDLFET